MSNLTEMNTNTKRFGAGFMVATLAAALLNLLPYLLTRGTYNSDMFEVAGFPFTFRRIGGFTGIHEFRVWALLADVLLALIVAATVGGYVSRSRHQQKS